MVLFVRPVRPASIRTFVEPHGSCLLAFSIAFGCCHLKRDLPLTVAGKFWSSHWAQSPELGDTYILVALMSFPVHPNLLIPTVSLVLHSPASGRRFRRLLAPAAAASGARLVNLAGHPQVVQQHRQFPRHRHARFLLRSLTAREISLCPKRRRSLSDPLRPRITCAPCTSSFRRYTSPSLLIPSSGSRPPLCRRRGFIPR